MTTVPPSLQVHLDNWQYRHDDAHGMIQEHILGDITEEELRTSPYPDLASVAWHVWHVARCEDVAINTIITHGGQVLDEDDWFARLNVPRRDIGTGMTPSEVAQFNASIDIGALRAYLPAVKQRTDEVMALLSPDDLTVVVDATRVDDALKQEVIGVNSEWVRSFWTGKTNGWFLWWLTAIHSYVHFGEALVTKDVVRRLRTQ